MKRVCYTLSPYHCQHCAREYKEKYYFDRHVATCQYLSKTARERIADIDSLETLPSAKDMFALIQHMALRIDNLESDNVKLKQKILQQRRKISILDWLNDPSGTRSPNCGFVDWVVREIIPCIPDALHVVFEHNLIDAVAGLFTRAVDRNSNSNDIPIRMFEHRTNCVYLFGINEESVWTQVHVQRFRHYLGQICHQFIVDFNKHWFMVHQDLIDKDDTYKDMYTNYFQKILGGGKLSDETLYNKIHMRIHAQLKQNLRAVVEFDFSDPT